MFALDAVDRSGAVRGGKQDACLRAIGSARDIPDLTDLLRAEQQAARAETTNLNQAERPTIEQVTRNYDAVFVESIAHNYSCISSVVPDQSIIFFREVDDLATPVS
jgi:hypothetical protein